VAQVINLDLTGPVVAVPEFLDTPRIDVESDDRNSRSRERHRHGQADIAQSDHGNLSAM